MCPETPPFFRINAKLAYKMGWIEDKLGGVRTDPTNEMTGVLLGPNLRQEFFTETVPSFKTSDVFKVDRDGDDELVLRALRDGFLQLSLL